MEWYFKLLPIILLAALISGVRGKTDCSSIRETLRIHWNLFIKDYPKLQHLNIADISEDMIRRSLYLMETKKFFQASIRTNEAYGGN